MEGAHDTDLKLARDVAVGVEYLWCATLDDVENALSRPLPVRCAARRLVVPPEIVLEDREPVSATTPDSLEQKESTMQTGDEMRRMGDAPDPNAESIPYINGGRDPEEIGFEDYDEYDEPVDAIVELDDEITDLRLHIEYMDRLIAEAEATPVERINPVRTAEYFQNRQNHLKAQRMEAIDRKKTLLRERIHQIEGHLNDMALTQQEMREAEYCSEERWNMSNEAIKDLMDRQQALYVALGETLRDGGMIKAIRVDQNKPEVVGWPQTSLVEGEYFVYIHEQFHCVYQVAKVYFSASLNGWYAQVRDVEGPLKGFWAIPIKCMYLLGMKVGAYDKPFQA
jgi:hypothetical protein